MLHRSTASVGVLILIFLQLKCSSPEEPDYTAEVGLLGTPVFSGLYVTREDYPEGTGQVIGTPAFAKGPGTINVFPNPYLGRNFSEINPYNRYVTFNHLSPSTTILIVRALGPADSGAYIFQSPLHPEQKTPIIVRKFANIDIGMSGFLQWDFRDERGVPVPSGFYRAYYWGPNVPGLRWIDLSISLETQSLVRF